MFVSAAAGRDRSLERGTPRPWPHPATARRSRAPRGARAASGTMLSGPVFLNTVPSGLAPPATRHGRGEHMSDQDTAQFLERGNPGHDLRQAVVPQGTHPLFGRLRFEVLPGRAPDGERLDLLGHHEQLVEADPALVARLPATWAALLAVEGHSVGGRHHLG